MLGVKFHLDLNTKVETQELCPSVNLSQKLIKVACLRLVIWW